MKSFRSCSVVAAGALLLAIVPRAPAAAAERAVDDFIASAREMITETWESIIAPITGGAVDAVTPPSPMSLARGMNGKSGSQFWDNLSDAGYDLADIETSVGIIPDVKMTFQLMRELSDADRDSLARKLEIGDMREPGLVASIQRRIIRTLLDASHINNMRVGKLVIGILPLPSAEFTLEPADAPLSEEHDALYRAISNKAKREKPRDKAVPLAPGATPPGTD